MEEVLGLRNIRQVFSTRGRQVLALDNVSLDVRRGEFLTIVGPSGCGKSFPGARSHTTASSGWKCEASAKRSAPRSPGA